MITKLLAATAIIAIGSSAPLAQAQEQPAQTESPAVVQQKGPTAEIKESEEALTPEEPTLATAFMGRAVYSSEDPESDNIGDVNDLIISEDGAITHAIVGVGGFLGIGEKDVAVPFDELQVVEQEGDIRLVYAATREQLEAAEQFDRSAFDPSARFADEQAALQPDAAAPATDTAPPTVEDISADQDIAATADPNATPAATDAQSFVQKAAVSNQFEIESSQLALEAAGSEGVKEFAQKMVDDHTKAGDDLKAAVEAAGEEIEIPGELDQEHADMLAQLKATTGAEFDKQYVEMQTQAHDQAVELFSSYAENGDNASLKEFAANTLPTLQDHKQQIHGVAGQ
jgi:putative membrane protein